MTITVRFFASLRESTGHREVAVDDARVETAGDAWRLATGGQPIPGNVFVAVKLETVCGTTYGSSSPSWAWTIGPMPCVAPGSCA